MSLKAWKVAGWLALLSAANWMLARGADTPPAVSPASSLSATLTNLSASGPKKDGLKQLEEELSKSLQPFSPRGSLDSIMIPRYIPPAIAPNRRPSNDSERRSNWPFGNQDDPSGLAQDPFKALEGSGKKNSLQDIYDTLGKQSSAKSDNSKRSGLKPFDDLDDDSLKLPSGIRDSARSLRDRLLGTDSIFNPKSASQSGLSSLFSPEDRLSPQQIQSHQEYLQRYRQTMDIPAPWAKPQNPLTSALGLGGAETKPVVTSPALLTGSSRDSFAATPTAVDSLLHPTALPDLNERAVNQWNPLYSPPKVETPAPKPFAPPMMEVPRRRF